MHIQMYFCVFIVILYFSQPWTSFATDKICKSIDIQPKKQMQNKTFSTNYNKKLISWTKQIYL